MPTPVSRAIAGRPKKEIKLITYFTRARVTRTPTDDFGDRHTNQLIPTLLYFNLIILFKIT